LLNLFLAATNEETAACAALGGAGAPFKRMAEANTISRFQFSRTTRLAVLTAHIAISVGLLGDSAGFLAVAVRLSHSEDAHTVTELTKVLRMFGLGFGIPLSFGALLSGIALGVGTRWGVFRYPWVVAKFALIVSVMAVGGLLIGPALRDILEYGVDASARLIAAAAYDVVALTIATALGVFKPGRSFRAKAAAG
jgi:hypothetical protein